MFKDLVVNPGTGQIDGLPNDWQTIFLADIFGTFGPSTFLGVISPSTPSLDEHYFVSAIAKAKVLVFQQGGTVIMEDITQGKKTEDDGFILSWRKHDEPWFIHKHRGKYSFAGGIIPPEKILFSFR